MRPAGALCSRGCNPDHACRLVAYLALSPETQPGGLLLMGIWPVLVLGWMMVNIRTSNKDVASAIGQLLAGVAIVAAPLLTYHVVHGPWVSCCAPPRPTSRDDDATRRRRRATSASGRAAGCRGIRARRGTRAMASRQWPRPRAVARSPKRRPCCSCGGAPTSSRYHHRPDAHQNQSSRLGLRAQDK